MPRQYGVDLSQTLHGAIDAIEKWRGRLFAIAQKIYGKFDHLERSIHAVSNIQKNMREPSDRNILGLYSGKFLFELGSAESINQSKYAAQAKGQGRPGLGNSGIRLHRGWK